MNVEQLRIAELSDVHLGNPNTPTIEILANLKKAFPDTHETGELDIIFFAGDVFDRLLYLPDSNVLEVRIWVTSFLRMCKRRDIMVRVLEGTPSHDWGQSDIFRSINVLADIDADLVYQDTLCIEYIERFGINVLYVPDEWRPETDDTWVEVKQLLKSHGLEKVDFSIMHGSFTYQLPSHVVGVPLHREDRYLGITEYFIFIGHIHKHSSYERILASGSFDRLCHNEEEPKGHLRVNARKSGEHEIVFVANEGAKRYDTVDCQGLDNESVIELLKKRAEALPDGSAIRILATQHDAVVNSIDEICSKYSNLRWSSKISKDAKVTLNDLQDMRAKYRGIDITSTNVVEILMKRLESKDLTPKQLEHCAALLNEEL